MLKAYQRALITALASVSTMPVPWERSSAASCGVIGGVDGVLGIDDRPRFHSYVAERHYPSYEYRDELRVGAVLPDAGVTYYEVPPEYSRAREYRYTIVNGHTVLVDPRTHTIIQIID